MLKTQSKSSSDRADSHADVEAGAPAVAATPIDRVLERVDEISTLPTIALRLMAVASDPDSGAADLKHVLEADPALSARVLRCVNSAGYGLPKRVTNLQLAISYLGFRQVRNLAMTACVSDVFKTDETVGPYRRSRLWRHLVSVALCARLIAARQRLPNFDDAFLGGLLHDLGIIIEDQHAHEDFVRMMQAIDRRTTLVELERQYLGFDHTEIGARVAEMWNFPKAVCACVQHHHDSGGCPADELAVVHCVQAANLICTLKGFTSVGLKLVKVPKRALARMKLQQDDIRVLIKDFEHEMSLNEHLFTL